MGNFLDFHMKIDCANIPDFVCYDSSMEEYIEGINKEFDGDWTVQDRMNKRFTKRIDLLVNVGTMGKWTNVKIELNE